VLRVVPRLVFSPNSCVSVVTHAVRVKMGPVKVAKVISSEKGNDSLVIKGFNFRFQKNYCEQYGTMVLY
jgi:hypothetical protein